MEFLLLNKITTRYNRAGAGMNRTVWLISITLLYVSIACAQNSSSENLVLNPSFEEKYYCPYYGSTEVKDTFACKDWIVTGTIDYFHTCSHSIDSLNSVPYNVYGYLPSHSGQGYIAGVFVDIIGGAEAIEGRLKKSLEQGKRYKVSFWIRTTDKAPYYTNNIGIRFIERKPAYYNQFGVIHAKYRAMTNDIQPGVQADVYNDPSRFITCTDQWIQICDTIVARGGENAFIIGAFWIDIGKRKLFDKYKKSGKTKYLEKYVKKYFLKENQGYDSEKIDETKTGLSKDQKDTYYFIDDVSVVELSPDQ